MRVLQVTNEINTETFHCKPCKFGSELFVSKSAWALRSFSLMQVFKIKSELQKVKNVRLNL